MHLGDAEAFADLGLGEFLHEPHVDDLPVPLIQVCTQRGPDRRTGRTGTGVPSIADA